MAAGGKTSRGRKGAVKETVATVGVVAMAAGSLAGAYLGFRLAGLGAAFLGLLAGGAVGFGVIYLLTNVVRQNSRFFTLIAALVIIGLVAWGLHALGGALGFNP